MEMNRHCAVIKYIPTRKLQGMPVKLDTMDWLLCNTNPFRMKTKNLLFKGTRYMKKEKKSKNESNNNT